MTEMGRRLRALRDNPSVKIRLLLSQGLFPPKLFMVRNLVVFRTSEVVPLKLTLDQVSVRWATPDDVPALETIDAHRSKHAELFEQGWVCTIAHWKDTPASYVWFDVSDVHVSTNNAFRFHLGPEACWGAYMFIVPEYRLRGVFHRHWVDSMRLLAERGIRNVYHSINRENEHSIRSNVRLGGEILGHYRVVRVAGLVRHRATRAAGQTLPESSGWGVWDARVAG